MAALRKCAIPNCPSDAAPDLTDCVCPPHARRIYTEVREMLERATTAQRLDAMHKAGRGTAMETRTAQAGFVYFFRMGDLVKIGWSSNVKQRARHLNAEAILGCFEGTPRDEKAMHARFGHLWERGEYFRADPELVEFAESVGRAA